MVEFVVKLDAKDYCSSILINFIFCSFYVFVNVNVGVVNFSLSIWFYKSAYIETRPYLFRAPFIAADIRYVDLCEEEKLSI